MKASPAGTAQRVRRSSSKSSSADAILASARRLFLADGYDGVNLERIAESRRYLPSNGLQPVRQQGKASFAR